MKKHYFYTTLLALFLFCLGAIAQENKQSFTAGKDPIEGLNIYPNPVSGGRLYITSKTGQNKDVAIFDVLGKKIMQATLSNNKELNVSDMTPGVYIIKVKEGEATSTRKLIVK
ncbi:T9SS type A sorting domain-containing protein [Flavobacterium sp. Sd200]|uniref:T9SS type A sorting domain-containing protein n=1 Tax=Flavobacterium sp. Sd200 TaxID=2692211 RepID=UPI00136B94A3|nr:T9SS type A sorting domain-containing protein [Flavobacterium sp. Sd200]MXN92148.1 T9SS type A sorting domain-containing protein [Flavobacterium sp. Sd200]